MRMKRSQPSSTTRSRDQGGAATREEIRRRGDTVNQAILKGMKVNAGDRPQSMQEWLALIAMRVEPAVPLSLQTPLVITAPSIKCLMPPQTPSVSLISGVGVDYSKLRDLLAVGKWREADKETRTVMLSIAGRAKEGWLRDEDIDNFHCQDLRTIDQLWVRYSNGGRFGFSVQKLIWQDVGKHYESFGNRVGWRNNSRWLSVEDITFELCAPRGHLPVVVCPLGWGDRRGWQ